jgi:Ring finger domain
VISTQADQVLSSSKACDPTVLASDTIQSEYKKATVQTDDPAAGREEAKPEGDCAICFDDMESSGEATVSCRTCRKHVHKECMRVWLANRGPEQQLKCVLCRSPWLDAEGAALLLARHLLMSMLCSMSLHAFCSAFVRAF